MARNENLHKAKTNKNDVFFTGDYDVEQELRFYWPHFKDKAILMNCNDILDEEGTGSAFWRYFRQRHDILGFKEIIATHYNPDGPSFGMRYDGVNETRFELQGHGEFDDEECIELLKESDIVITNPPFSRFSHGFVDSLMKYEKKFLIIGPLMAITYKEFFPYLKNDQVWLGVNANKTMQFVMPEDYELKGRAYIDDSGNKIGFVPGITWYTNIDNRRRNEKLFLVETYAGNEQHYPKYDNYDAINVDKCREIPKDYYGVMGVPISFMCVYNSEQFEIVGADIELAQKMSDIDPDGEFTQGGPAFYLKEGTVTLDNGQKRTKYRRLPHRLLIRNRALNLQQGKEVSDENRTSPD